MMKFVILMVFLFLATWQVLGAFERVIARQDAMLCNSAKISGNTEYLAKCQCFYDGEGIACLYKP